MNKKDAKTLLFIPETQRREEHMSRQSRVKVSFFVQ